jgi:hypothetical protein
VTGLDGRIGTAHGTLYVLTTVTGVAESPRERGALAAPPGDVAVMHGQRPPQNPEAEQRGGDHVA